MKKIKFIFVLLLFVQVIYTQDSQGNNAWDTLLDDVKVKYVYSLKYNALLPKPKFGRELQAMNGQNITLRGFFMPVDMTSNVYVLSYNPTNMCFFCNGAGIETIVELNPKQEDLRNFKRLEADNYFEVKGRLRLNADDYEHLIYILDEVEFVKRIK